MKFWFIVRMLSGIRVECEDDFLDPRPAEGVFEGDLLGVGMLDRGVVKDGFLEGCDMSERDAREAGLSGCGMSESISIQSQSIL